MKTPGKSRRFCLHHYQTVDPGQGGYCEQGGNQHQQGHLLCFDHFSFLIHTSGRVDIVIRRHLNHFPPRCGMVQASAIIVLPGDSLFPDIQKERGRLKRG